MAFVFDKYAVPYENMVKYRALPELNTSPLLAEIQSPPMMVPDDIQETLVGGSDDGERESLGQEREEADEGALLPSEEGVQEEVMADSNSQQRQQQRGGPQREGVSCPQHTTKDLYPSRIMKYTMYNCDLHYMPAESHSCQRSSLGLSTQQTSQCLERHTRRRGSLQVCAGMSF